MNNNKPKSREITPNGELFILEKVKEIIPQIHEKLESIEIHVQQFPIDYVSKISREIYNKLSPKIKFEYNLSRTAKGKLAIQEIKKELKSKIALEISFMFSDIGQPTEFEINLINHLEEFIEKIETSPLHHEIKNRAWNYD